MAEIDELERVLDSLDEKRQSGGNVRDYFGNIIMTAVPASAQQVLEMSKAQGREFRAKPLSHRVQMLEGAVRALEEKKSELAKLYCRESGKPVSACRAEVASAAAIGRHLAKKLEGATSFQRGGETEIEVDKPLHHMTLRVDSLTDMAKAVFSSIGSGTPLMLLPRKGAVATAYDVKALLSGVADAGNIAVEFCREHVDGAIDLSRRRQVFVLAGDCDYDAAAGIVSDRVMSTHKPVYVFVDGSIAEPFVGAVHESLKAFKGGDPADVGTGIRSYCSDELNEFARQKASVPRKPKFGLQIAGKQIMPGLYLAGEFDRHIPNNITFGPVVAAFEYGDISHGAHYANLLRMESASVFSREIKSLFEVVKALDAPFIFSNSAPQEEKLAEGVLSLMQRKRRVFLNESGI
ncbi:MAG: aldehyde dehydrogenase family protein [archaeon]